MCSPGTRVHGSVLDGPPNKVGDDTARDECATTQLYRDLNVWSRQVWLHLGASVDKLTDLSHCVPC